MGYSLTIEFDQAPGDRKAVIEGLIQGLEKAGLAAKLTDSHGDNYSAKPGGGKAGGNPIVMSHSGAGGDQQLAADARAGAEKWRDDQLRARGITP